MSTVSKSRVPMWVDTTPGGFQVVSSGHWRDGVIEEPMHRLGSTELSQLYTKYDALIAATEVDSGVARSFHAFRTQYFNGGAVVRDAPQVLWQPTPFGGRAAAFGGAAAVGGIASGLLAGRAWGAGIGAAVGAVVGLAAGIGGAALLERIRRSGHEARIDDFRRAFDEQVQDPDIRAIVELETRIFETERDPSKEGSPAEKARLIAGEMVSRLDRDGDGAVSWRGATPEATVRPRNFELADANADGRSTREEITASLLDHEAYRLDQDDTFLHRGGAYDKNDDAVIDLGNKYQEDRPANGTNEILALWTG